MLARFNLFIAAVLLLFLCAVGAVAQQQSAPWPPYVPPPPPTDSSADPLAPAGARAFDWGVLPRDNPPALTVERLPPVEPFWPIVPVYPPLLGPGNSAASQEVMVDGQQPGRGSSLKEGNEKKDEGEEKKDVPEIEGDRLPQMIETVVIDRTPWYYLDFPWFEPWEGSFEMGLDGSSGNSETFNIRLGAEAKRKTKRHSFLFDLDYHKNTNDAVETANRLYLEERYERLSETNPWTWFLKQTTDYDEFQPWDVRVVATTGLGYRFLDDEITTLTTRLGSGFSQNVGGPDQDCVPEMSYGLEYGHRMTKRQKIGISVEYFPNVTDYTEFRMVNKADWEVTLDKETNLSLKVSVVDRYSYPNPGGKVNDLDYSLVLLWSF